MKKKTKRIFRSMREFDKEFFPKLYSEMTEKSRKRNDNKFGAGLGLVVIEDLRSKHKG